MAQHVPSSLDQPDEIPDLLDIDPGKMVSIHHDEFRGRKLEIYDEQHRQIAVVYRNLQGNTAEERSYTLELSGGHRILLPVPYFCNTASFLFDLKPNEDLHFGMVSQKAQYRLADAHYRDVSSVRPTQAEKMDLSREWQEVPLADHQVLNYETKNGKLLARLYKVPGRTEYILRDVRGIAHATFTEGDEKELTGNSNKKIFFRVQKGKFSMKGEQDLVLRLEGFPTYQKVEAGRGDDFEEDMPEVLEGVMYGGRSAALASYREVGAVKPALLHRNEDNGGFNNELMVVVDGMGGHPEGALVADYAVDCLLKAKGDFKKKLADTHERLHMFTNFYRQLAQQIEEGYEETWFKDNGFSSSGREKKMNVPDGVMSAVTFDGNKLKTVVLGDSKVYVVRGNDVVYESREHSLVANRVARGAMTQREALQSLERSVVISTLVGSFAPDYDEFLLQPGDRIVVMSDGGIMPNGLIVAAVQNRSATGAVQALLKEKADENMQGGAYYDLNDGGAPVVVASKDNTTYGVIVWD